MISESFTDYQKLFSEMAVELQEMDDIGTVASYIPELRNVDPNKFGIHLTTIDNRHYCLGDSNDKFSIQSISKVLALSLAFDLEAEKLWGRVGVEPSGTPFNSLVQLEYEKGIPRNPLINAGALVICDVLVSRLKNPKQEFIEFTRNVSGNHHIDYCPRVAESEKLTGFKNASLINIMKSCGNIKNDIEIVLDFYFTSVLHRNDLQGIG
jgi:glutaminase